MFFDYTVPASTLTKSWKIVGLGTVVHVSTHVAEWKSYVLM